MPSPLSKPTQSHGPRLHLAGRKSSGLALALWLLLGAAAFGCRDDAPESGAEPAADGLIVLAPAALKNAKLETAAVGSVKLKPLLSFQGDVKLVPEQSAKVVARVGGVLRQLDRKQGDAVAKGDRLAVIDSRELGETALQYVESSQQVRFTRSAMEREQQLVGKGIASKDDYRAKQRAFEEASIAWKNAKQRLNVLGIADERIGKLTRRTAAKLSQYEIHAPMAGTVVKAGLTKGQAVTAETELFELADLSSVYVLLKVPAKQLAVLDVGTPVSVKTKVSLTGEGKIDRISPTVDLSTRTAEVRAAIPNPDGKWRPGICATVEAQVGEIEVALGVAKQAIVELGQTPSVFVQRQPGRFEPRAVTVGREDDQTVEIEKGLKAGELVVTVNVLVLKSAWEQQGAQ